MKISEEKWNTGAAMHLMPACDDDYTINDLAFDVQNDSCSLFHMYEAGKHVASMVLRLESNSSGKELVVVCLGGKTASGSLIDKISEFWDNLAKKNDTNTIRAHVSNKGMARLMERAGGKLTEYVYKRRVV